MAALDGLMVIIMWAFGFLQIWLPLAMLGIFMAGMGFVLYKAGLNNSGVGGKIKDAIGKFS